jgi:hypothetical protein
MKFLLTFLLLMLSAGQSFSLQASKGNVNDLPVLDINAEYKGLNVPLELSGVFTQPRDRFELSKNWLNQYIEKNKALLNDNKNEFHLFVTVPKIEDCYNPRLGSDVAKLKPHILAFCALCANFDQVEQIKQMIEWAGVEVEIPRKITEINFFGTNDQHIRVLKHESPEVLEKILQIPGVKAVPPSAVVLELNSVRKDMLYLDNAYLQRNC